MYLIVFLYPVVICGRNCLLSHIKIEGRGGRYWTLPGDCTGLIVNQSVEFPSSLLDAIMKHGRGLILLDFKRLNLDEENLERLLKWAHERIELEELRLGGNIISSKPHIRKLLEFLIFRIKRLELQDTGINDVHIKSIINSCLSSRTIEYINLEHNPGISNESIQLLAQLIYSKNNNNNNGNKIDIVHPAVYDAYQRLIINQENNQKNKKEDENSSFVLLEKKKSQVVHTIEELLIQCNFLKYNISELASALYAYGANDVFKLAQLKSTDLNKLNISIEDQYDFSHCVCHNYIYGKHFEKLRSSIKAKHVIERHIPDMCQSHFERAHRQTQRALKNEKLKDRKDKEYHQLYIETRVQAELAGLLLSKNNNNEEL